MRRLGYERFGGPDVLSWRTAALPMPGRGEVLVRTRAASINATDEKILSGSARIMKVGRRRPFGFGLDIAGTVEALGPGAHGVSIGDRVVGMTRDGDAFADASIAKSTALVRLPDSLDFVQGVTLAMSGGTAIGLVDALRVHAGERVLVGGGSGAIGDPTVQLLVRAGCTVAATGSASSADLLRGLGAEPHDYRALDLGVLAGRFDVVVDVSGHLPASDAALLLADGGRYATLVPSGAALGAQAAGVVLRDRPRVQNLIVTATAERIGRAVSLAASGDLRPETGAVHPLEDVVEVLKRRAAGTDRTHGKIVFTADDSAQLS
ncbi:alcohol dehydrogenase catalytic domain-containing protein [Rathayibacter sp. VKM Ac-2803]|uniref:NADP-dependent oxidoreductase n=1 Tax=unclassified Rathayibacter TaxID=2609250 RepID=UPI001357D057|nr:MULTISPECIES: NADP-dependent oxidoreductase [unclassified Rathayibacter]MWV51209.1 alcohol dehydrogenase catalytic domain-containing protein [Rathayibacter sp. VKM Ac-2803]MWV57693.1 alcohol dehydrogenase catalytic domain-containing protein [Rathayibacter sp. VKM Ac-2754]